ncbi:MAG TPA: TIR domain-containing protein [bacterium]|nr:TIR domain-containing protein [bacterium]
MKAVESRAVPRPRRVFVSYSHDSPEHLELVWALSEQLRREGVDCRIDQYEPAPPEGWPRWCERQIRDADFVIVICTRDYLERFELREKAGVGKGAKWEGAIISQEIYDAEGKNDKFVPVVFRDADLACIPDILSGAQWYSLTRHEGYDRLYRRITNQPETPMSPLGPITPKPPRVRVALEALTRKGDFADTPVLSAQLVSERADAAGPGFSSPLPARSRTPSDKLATLLAITSEALLRKSVLAKLFGSFCDSVWDVHGADERGVDLLCRTSSPFGHHAWVGVIARTGVIVGTVVGPNSILTVAKQVMEAFARVHQPGGSTDTVFLNQVVVVTTSEITAAAIGKLDEIIAAPSLRANTHVLDGEALVRLIDQHQPGLWADLEFLRRDVPPRKYAMDETAALVLYVIVDRLRRLPSSRRRNGIATASVRSALRFQHSEAQFDQAVDYLLGEAYLKRTRLGHMALEPNETAPTLVTDPLMADVLLAAWRCADSRGRFDERHLRQALGRARTKRPGIRFARPFLDALIRMSYIARDTKRGITNYVLNIRTLSEELPYLRLLVKHRFE